MLVVDDDKEKLYAWCGAISKKDSYARVLVAYNGEAALHAIRRERPDCVILDLMLP